MKCIFTEDELNIIKGVEDGSLEFSKGGDVGISNTITSLINSGFLEYDFNHLIYIKVTNRYYKYIRNKKLKELGV
jgi:hypothetical protein